MKQHYQLAIIGGGMQGATLFWEAVHRGIDSILIEREDYGSGTTANSLRVVHGGLRHLQRADMFSCLQMIREQRVLMQIAPALVRPLHCAMPTAARGMRSAPVMATGLWGYDRLRDIEAMGARSKVKLPASGLRNAHQLGASADLQVDADTSACWHDAQALHAERLALAFINSGRARGGTAANYREVIAAGPQGDGYALTIRDTLRGGESAIRAAQVIDCSSDWRFYRSITGQYPARHYVKAVNLVLGTTASMLARAVYVNNESVRNRLLFLTPWRNRLVAGTWYFPVHDRAGQPRLSQSELATCVRDLNSVLIEPINAASVAHAQVGYLPVEGELPAGDDPAAHLLKNSNLVALERRGYYIAEATKFTTARRLAEQAIDRLATDAKLQVSASASCTMPLQQEFDTRLFSPERLQCYTELLQENHVSLPAAVIEDAHYALAHEQVETLADLVRRRLPLGDICQPPAAVTQTLLALASARLGWSDERRSHELQRLAAEYPLTGIPH